MDATTRFLIRVAAIVIVAAGAYYSWDLYQAASLEAEKAASLEAARAEIFRLAEADPDQVDKVRNWCRTAATTVFAGDAQAVADNFTRKCRALGYLD